MSDHVDTGAQRRIRLYPGRDRLSARTFHSSSGQAILVDGIIGFDGLPSSIPNRRTSRQEKGKWFERYRANKGRGRVMIVTRYPLSTIYLTALMLIGSYGQGWLGWIVG